MKDTTLNRLYEFLEEFYHYDILDNSNGYQFQDFQELAGTDPDIIINFLLDHIENN